MTCYHPNNAHITGTKSDGKKILKFGLPAKANQEALLLPCGQCIGCRLDRSIMWAARCMHEAQMHEQNCFLTLTYNEENLPYDGSLTPSHFTNFMKRYRHHVSPNKIRFFHGAEYGDNLQRPHHHVCIFGHEFTDTEIFRECEGIYTYYSPTLEDLWGKGFCTQQDLTLESAAYVARYCLKKITGDKAHAHYERICPITGEIRQIQPEYATMSRGTGIGKDWYDKYHSDIFPYDTTIYKGKNIRTPRYYENLLRSADLPLFEEIKDRRKQKAIKQSNNNTPERLRVREQHKRITFQQLNRTLHNET